MKQFLIAAVAVAASLSPAVANSDQSAKVSADAPGCYNATDNRIPCADQQGAEQAGAGSMAEFTPIVVMPQPSGRHALAIAPPMMVPPSIDVSDLKNTRWTIVAIDGNPVTASTLNTPTLSFGLDDVRVATGCRGFGATINVKAGSNLFEIQPEPKIAIQCSDDLEAQELRIGTIIATAVNVSLNDIFGLTISDANGGSLTAKPLKPTK